MTIGKRLTLTAIAFSGSIDPIVDKAVCQTHTKTASFENRVEYIVSKSIISEHNLKWLTNSS